MKIEFDIRETLRYFQCCTKQNVSINGPIMYFSAFFFISRFGLR